MSVPLLGDLRISLVSLKDLDLDVQKYILRPSATTKIFFTKTLRYMGQSIFFKFTLGRFRYLESEAGNFAYWFENKGKQWINLLSSRAICLSQLSEKGYYLPYLWADLDCVFRRFGLSFRNKCWNRFSVSIVEQLIKIEDRSIAFLLLFFLWNNNVDTRN